MILTLFSVKNATNDIKILVTRNTFTIVNKPLLMHHHHLPYGFFFTHLWFPCVSQEEGIIYKHAPQVHLDCEAQNFLNFDGLEDCMHYFNKLTQLNLKIFFLVIKQEVVGFR